MTYRGDILYDPKRDHNYGQMTHSGSSYMTQTGNVADGPKRELGIDVTLTCVDSLKGT